MMQVQLTTMSIKCINLRKNKKSKNNKQIGETKL